ncbi:hypothetical protein K8T06_03450 [bacterium]|nr:hypothetical protein [bacterium]
MTRKHSTKNKLTYNPSLVTTWEGKLPKTVDDTEIELALKNYLQKNLKALSHLSRFQLPVIQFGKEIKQALVFSHKDHSLIRGLPGIRKLLENENAGLKKLAKIDSSSAPKRISRILLISKDGSDRFKREINDLLLQNNPRLAGIILNCTASELGLVISGKSGMVKAVLASHKNSVNLILSTLIRRLKNE